MLNDIVYRLSRNEHLFKKRTPILQCKEDFIEFIRTRKAPKTAHNYESPSITSWDILPTSIR